MLRVEHAARVAASRLVTKFVMEVTNFVSAFFGFAAGVAVSLVDSSGALGTARSTLIVVEGASASR